VEISSGETKARGSANVDLGWEDALARAVGMALRAVSTEVVEPKLTVNS